MLKKTELREAALSWIENLPSGTKFTYQDVYKFLRTNFPEECAERGDAPKEPRYMHDTRAAVWDAMPKYKGLIKSTGIRGKRQRV